MWGEENAPPTKLQGILVDKNLPRNAWLQPEGLETVPLLLVLSLLGQSRLSQGLLRPPQVLRWLNSCHHWASVKINNSQCVLLPNQDSVCPECNVS